MIRFLKRFWTENLVVKLFLTVGSCVLIGIFVWSAVNIRWQDRMQLRAVAAEADRLSSTIKLGAHYAMMLNAREDIAQIIGNTSRQDYIENIRIYNKQGEIKFSDDPSEVDKMTDIAENEACQVCHQGPEPKVSVPREDMVRIFQMNGHRALGMMSPIYNEPGCSGPPCHFHPADAQVLGLLDIVVSLEETDAGLVGFKMRTLLFAVVAMLMLFAPITFFVFYYVKRPVGRMIEGTARIAEGRSFMPMPCAQRDEMGRLCHAINTMGQKIERKQAELDQQRREYREFFERVPCLVTVIDRNFRLINFNKDFAERYNAKVGAQCFSTLKDRSSKCDVCLVEKTFEQGTSLCSEETWIDDKGQASHWIITTSPIKDDEGNVVSAMEMCLEITARKKLEQRLEISEKKYHEIFNHIPNMVFVLDYETLEILECNHAVMDAYGYAFNEIIGRWFLSLFREEDRAQYKTALRTKPVHHQVVQYRKNGEPFYVSMWVSPTEYADSKVLLVTASDITKRLETEQQLIQSGKMATLGEMATGVAHELNQPLTVIKTAASFLSRKSKAKKPIKEDVLASLTDEIESHVDRAAKIISHMREFGRKPDILAEPVQINDVLRKAFEIFSQQLKLREIEVVWELEENLPLVRAEANRLEQVFINLLINARDAIEDRWQGERTSRGDKRITIMTRSQDQKVHITVSDTGPGVPESVASRIFEPFFTTKDVGKGTGLGLSISYGIVKDYGGTIEVASTRGEGASFLITFRVYEDEHAPAAKEGE